jgi:hypothetical protein
MINRERRVAARPDSVWKQTADMNGGEPRLPVRTIFAANGRDKFCATIILRSPNVACDSKH